MNIMVGRTGCARNDFRAAVGRIRYGAAPSEAHVPRSAGTWLAVGVVFQGGGYRK